MTVAGQYRGLNISHQLSLPKQARIKQNSEIEHLHGCISWDFLLGTPEIKLETVIISQGQQVRVFTEYIFT
jgi:hypothetical protein